MANSKLVHPSEFAHRFAIHKGGIDEDGRSGWHIIRSAIAYLDYRRGTAWRPTSHRFHPEVEWYTLGIALLLQLSMQRYYPQPSIKKQPQRVMAAAAARRAA